MLKVLELFGGIGACSKALERLGIDYEIADYVEIDKYAVKSFNAMHGTNFEPQDICEWDKDIDVDLVMHGSPCQDFSVAGRQAGGDAGSGTRSSLMYETIRIVEKLKPKYVIWENVKNLLSKKHKHNFDAYLETMEQLGYTNYYQVLNAKDYGIPQNRERVFTISILGDDDYSLLPTAPMETGDGNVSYFQFPPKQELNKCLNNLLEDEVDNGYYLNEKQLAYVLDMNDVALKSGRDINQRVLNPSIAKTISCRGAADQRADVTNFVVGDNNEEVRVCEIKDKIVAQHFEFPPKQESSLRLKDVLEDNVPEDYYLSDDYIYTVSHWNAQQKPLEKVRGKNSIAPTLTARGAGENHAGMVLYSDVLDDTTNLQEQCYHIKDNPERTETVFKEYSNFYVTPRATDGELINGSYNRVWKDDKHVGAINVTKVQEIGNVRGNTLRIRKLTPKECWRLMGFDDSDFEKAASVNSKSQLYKQAGNSIVVNVLEEIFKNLFNLNK